MSRNPKASTMPASGRTASVAALSRLCSEAAQHVAKARMALYTEHGDAEKSLAHLDEAILCLRRLLAYGRASGANGSRARVRSA